MQKTTIKHRLYEIDLEKKTAFCTACGYTNIHVTRPRAETAPSVYCIKRVSEKRERAAAKLQKKREERQLLPGWKPLHRLSEIDPENKTAVCAVCGPTDIWKNYTGGKFHYACATKQRDYMRKYMRAHYVSQTKNPQIHKLSDIDEEKKTAVCSQCGPVMIELRRGKRKITRRCTRVKLIQKTNEK